MNNLNIGMTAFAIRRKPVILCHIKPNPFIPHWNWVVMLTAIGIHWNGIHAFLEYDCKYGIPRLPLPIFYVFRG